MSNILAPGTRAPDFTLPVTPDRELSLKELRGRPVILPDAELPSELNGHPSTAKDVPLVFPNDENIFW